MLIIRLKRKLDDLDSWSICHRLCLRQFLVGPALTVVDVSVVVETVVTITVTEDVLRGGFKNHRHGNFPWRGGGTPLFR